MAVQIKTEPMRRARATLMVQRRLLGHTYKQIAEEFHVSTETVSRALTFAHRAGLVTRFEDQILGELVPLAISQFKKAIEGGDTAAASEVLKATGLLLKPQERATPKLGDVSHDIDLAEYVRKLRADAEALETSVEGELLTAGGGQTALPAPEGAPPERRPAALEGGLADGTGPLDGSLA